jgi:glycosyltransferase involved in cell wall biosynthesis
MVIDDSQVPIKPARNPGLVIDLRDGHVERHRVLPTVTVVIPTLNEAKNLPHVLTRLPAELHELILVDGGSVDNTVEVARALRPDVKLVRQSRRGKGNALACGFRAATGDVIVMLDADGSADPAEIPAFVEALVSGADFAKGTRFAEGGGSGDITPLRRIGNWALNFTVNSVYRTRYTDLCYGYNAFWRYCLTDLRLLDDDADAPLLKDGSRWGDGFEIETLMNVRLALAGSRVREVPSFEHSRIHGVSNLRTFRDGIRVLRTILRERTYRRAQDYRAETGLTLRDRRCEEHGVILPCYQDCAA